MEHISRMFNHQGKTVRVIGKNRIKTYQDIYKHLDHLQQANVLPTHDNYLGDNELAKNIYSKKYFLKDLNEDLIETCPEDVFKRTASFLATVEKTKPKQKKWAEKFYNQLYEGRFVPGGRVLAGAGDLYRLKTLANCFVAKINRDDIDSIYEAAYECARTYSYGGGIGVDISCLRPKNSIVHNAADSSTGAVSFMELYSLTTGLIGQSGRRGALMLTIDVKHPDIRHFLNVKKTPNWVTNQIIEQCSWSGLFNEEELETIEKQVIENTQVRFANISIKISDEFMHAVDEHRTYGETDYLVYKKTNRTILNQAPQNYEDRHYSSGIPSKIPADYQLIKNFSSFEDLQNWLSKTHALSIDEEPFNDASHRDVYGDYVLSLSDQDYDLALKQSGDFMLYFSSKPTGEIREIIKARDIWDPFIEGNYKTAEPGLIFWSTMSRYSPSNYIGKPIICTNPCAEVPLEEGGACNLGSLNLSRFVTNGYKPHASIDWDQLAETTAILTRFLDNVVTWNEDLNALKKQRKAAQQTRRLGLGIMGIADMLNQLGIGYDTHEGIDILTKVISFITNAAYQASASLAAEKGASPIFVQEDYFACPFVKETLSKNTQKLIQKHGLRNIAIMSIAPTGSISNIVLGYQNDSKNYIGVSGGIEPIFALYYTRRSESFGNKIFKVFHSTVQAFIDKMDLQKEIDGADRIEKVLPDYFLRTAHEIDPDKRVEIQGKVQKYIDHSISSTINLPEDVDPEVISNIYLKAWKHGLKGVTIYRDGSRFPILRTTQTERTAFQNIKEKEFRIIQKDGTEQIVHGDEIVKLPDGTLTNVYHFMKNNEGMLEEIIT